MKTFIGVVMYGLGMCGMGYYFGNRIGVAKGKKEAYVEFSEDVNDIIERISDDDSSRNLQTIL